MLLGCHNFIKRHSLLNDREIVNWFIRIRKKDIPLNLFNSGVDYKSYSYFLYDSDKKVIYIAFKGITRGFSYYKSCTARVIPLWLFY